MYIINTFFSIFHELSITFDAGIRKKKLHPTEQHEKYNQ